MAKTTIDTECDECGGTGLYSGFCEAKGEAVICCRCDGSGLRKISYTPFTKRRPRKGIKTVKLSRGGFIATGVGGVGSSITYKEFEQGKMPKGGK